MDLNLDNKSYINPSLDAQDIADLRSKIRVIYDEPIGNIPKNASLEAIAGWENTTSAECFSKVKKTLISFVESFQKELVQEEERTKNELIDIDRRYASRIDDERRRLLTDPKAENERVYKSSIDKLSSRWSTGNGARVVYDREIAPFDFSYNPGLINTIISYIDRTAIDAMQAEKAELRSNADSVEVAVRKAKDAAKRLRDAKDRLCEKAFASLRDVLAKEQAEKKDEAEKSHKSRSAAIAEKYSEQFKKYFSEEKIATSFNAAQVFMRPAKNYTASNRIPESMFFGMREFAINCPSGEFYPEVQNLFKDIHLSNISVTDKCIKVRLPYSRTLEEGYSVYLSSYDVESEQSEKMLKSYILKILMNFPAGQTRPLLLDSDSKATFTMFKTIGESSGRLVTRPWSKEEDIEREINKLADERANLNISYGEDVKSRLLREPIYFAACRNFPKGVTSAALDGLYTIFLAGAKNGFFGLIQSNKREEEARANDHKWSTTIQTIKQNSLVISEKNGAYYVEDAATGTSDAFFFDTIDEAFENQREIISEIISGVSLYRRQIEKFEHLFSKDAGNVEGIDAKDMNTWFTGNASKRFEVPIGISGASTVQKYVVESVAQHALISGVTQSGKSSLLRTILISSMIKYTPENLNLYLIDFKEGVEFEPFGRYRLPWVKVISLDTKREFALNILKDLSQEFKRRADKMRQHSVSNISQVPGEKFPRVILVFDEVQELLRESDAITSECVSILAQLVSEGAAMNMNIILTSQDFTNCNGLERLMANMVIRIAFKGSPNSAKKIMGEDFSVEQLEQGDSGYAAINSASGAKGKTNFFQVGYLNRDEADRYLVNLATIMKNKETDTQIFSQLISQDIYHKFNRFIFNGEIDASETPQNYEFTVGDNYRISAKRLVNIAPKEGHNLLVIGESENVARSVFSLSILSVLYDEISCGAKRIDNELVRIVDLSVDDDTYFSKMKDLFSKQLSITGLSGIEDMINDTYDKLQERIRGEVAADERLFLALFGLDGAYNFYRDMYMGDDDSNFANKLAYILERGPAYGINTIIWTHTLDGIYKFIQNSVIGRHMRKRLFFGDNEEDYGFMTTKKHDPAVLNNEALLYVDNEVMGETIFRKYMVPEIEWVEDIAKRYKEYEKNHKNEEA